IEEDNGTLPVPGDLSVVERQMLLNLLHFGERQADEIAVPRADIVAFDLAQPFSAPVELFIEAGHSRIPVYRGDLDQLIGMIHIKDVYALLAQNSQPTAPAIEALVRPALFVPESMGVLDLLARMRAERTHMAIVV